MLICFIDDKFGLASREHLNMVMVTWECDCPHSDSKGPQSPELLHPLVAGLSDEDIDKVTHLDAMKQFHYDPFTFSQYALR